MEELTNAQIERLAILSEECGEVIQIVGKILRHGYKSFHPLDPMLQSNKLLLQNELGDLVNSINFLAEHKDVDIETVYTKAESKKKRFVKWLKHQE